MGAVIYVTRWRTGKHLAIGGLTAVMLASVALPAAASEQSALARARTDLVPWRHAGPGWSVVEYSTASTSGSHRGPATIYLVSPSGRRYPFYRTAPMKSPGLLLIDWSGDRRRILVRTGSLNQPRVAYEQISLATGAVVTKFSLPKLLMPVGYTRPRGSGLLVMGPTTFHRGFRYDLAGHLRATLAPGAKLFGLLDSPDGTFIVAGTTAGVDLISNAGHVTRRIEIPIPKPASQQVCGLIRWWTRTSLLADCSVFGASTQRFWLVPVRGGTPRPLTPAVRPDSIREFFNNVWRLPSGLYLQADNLRNRLSIVRQAADGKRHTIHIPGPAGLNDFIVGSLGARLLIASGTGQQPSESLLWYNPATRAIRYVFRTPPKAYGVAGVVSFGLPTP
jgi:hypothetical protein